MDTSTWLRVAALLLPWVTARAQELPTPPRPPCAADVWACWLRGDTDPHGPHR